MNEGTGDAKTLGDMVTDLITQGKISKVERAFRKNPTLMSHVRDYWEAHEKYERAHKKFMSSIEQACKKEDCDIPGEIK